MKSLCILLLLSTGWMSGDLIAQPPSSDRETPVVRIVRELQPAIAAVYSANREWPDLGKCVRD